MHSASIIRLSGFRAAWCALALAGMATAGEPIRFSGRTGPAQPLALERREPFLPTEASSDRIGQRSGPPSDGFLYSVQPVTPTVGLTRKQLEAQEQRRNWFMQSPETILKQAIERDDPRLDDSVKDDRRVKPPAERMKEEREGKTSSEDRHRNENTASRDRNSLHERRDANGNLLSGESKAGFETRNGDFIRAREDGGFFGLSDARSGAMSRAVTEAKDRERQRERDASLDAFKRTFGNPWAQTTSVGGTPTMSASGPSSATPTVSAVQNDFRRGVSGMGAFDAGTRAKMELGPRGGGFDPQNPLNYGGPETVLKQNEAPRTAPKPVVLEIPKRKF